LGVVELGVVELGVVELGVRLDVVKLGVGSFLRSVVVHTPPAGECATQARLGGGEV